MINLFMYKNFLSNILFFHYYFIYVKDIFFNHGFNFIIIHYTFIKNLVSNLISIIKYLL